MITIAICDDNAVFSNMLSEKINNLISSSLNKTCMYNVLSPFNGGRMYLEATKDYVIDALFLDIDMPEIGGFELAERLKELKHIPLIIFVSSFDNMVYGSFNYSPFGFVRKSNLDYDLKQTMERVISHFNQDEKTITLHTKDGIHNIKISEILYVECKNNYYTVKETSNAVYTCRGSITSIDKELEYSYFFKVHAAFIVNIKHVRSFYAKDGCVEMSDGVKIYIGKRRIAAFKKAYLDYLRKGI